jgi:hypothetical protein
LKKRFIFERETPKQESAPVVSSSEKDVHGFTASDYLYAQKAFNNDNKEMWTRVGRIVEFPTKASKNQAKLFDHEKGIDIWSEFIYMTAPAQINNINDGDIVFVFHNGKKPQDQRQARTSQWKMCRVTNTEELFKEQINISAWPWTCNIDAVRVMINSTPKAEVSTPAPAEPAVSSAKDAHGFKATDCFYFEGPFEKDSNITLVVSR